MDDLIALPPATPPMSPYTSCFKPTVHPQHRQCDQKLTSMCTSSAAKPCPCKVDLGTKYIVVSGGVCSSLGKGVTTSSIGALLRGEAIIDSLDSFVAGLQERVGPQGYHVTAIKMDPYLNPDAGLMSPFEHGEVLVSLYLHSCCHPSSLWFATARFTFWTMVARQTWTWETMSA
eukprot:5410385-Amphidinium_carterae.2